MSRNISHIIISLGNRRGLVVSVVDLIDRSVVRICLVPEHFDVSLSVVPDWVMKGLGVYSRIGVTGHKQDPVPLVKQSRASCPGGRFPPSFIHQVIIITGLNNFYECMFSP